MSLISLFKSPDNTPSVQFEKTESIFKETTKTPAQRQKKPIREIVNDNVKTYSNGTAFKEIDKEACEWNRIDTITDIENRSNDLTYEDIQEIKTQGLKVNVAIILKAIWARGATISDAVKATNGKRYFGRRSIEKYWSIFNRSHSPE